MNNPYTSRGGLHDARMFIGREHELKELGAFIYGNQSVSIIGPRKIGKTSLMLHLLRDETLTALSLERENLFVYIDCQTLSSNQHDQIFAHFCTEISVALRTRGLKPEPALKAAVSMPSRPAFEAALRKLNQRGLRVVLMLDEFEQLTINPDLDVNFYNALRSAAGRLRLVFLTASALPLIELTYSERSQKILSSPFFNIFAPLFVGLLSEVEARNLIRVPWGAAGMRTSPKLENFIYELAGGHPLALQIACYHAWESPDDLLQIELRTKQELEAHFQYYWHNLSTAEREILRNPSEASTREHGDAALRIIFRSLIRKCLLRQIQGSYSYPSKAWQEFVSVQVDNPRPVASTHLPAQIGSAGTKEKGKPVKADSETATVPMTGSKAMEQTIRQVMRQSLPEAIGGLFVAIVIGIVTVLYRDFPVLIEAVKDIDAYTGWAWLILAAFGTLMLGMAVVRIIRK